MDGVLIIDKPVGLTSHDVVARVRRALGEKRVGHTGTLDPFATGVLVLLVGRATRLAQFLANAVKEYEAVIRFGYATETGDATGERRALMTEGAAIDADACEWSDEEIEAALQALRGEIAQVPPMYSAKKVKGQKLYELARRGEVVERAPVRVTVHEFEALKRDGALLSRNEDGTCDLSVRVVCSAGTYVRALAEAVGENLRTGAHLASLRRTRAGDFKMEDAIGLSELKERAEAGSAQGTLLSMDAALSFMPFLHLTAEEARRARHGIAVFAGAQASAKYSDGEHLRMRDEHGELIGIGVYEAGSATVRPRIVVVTEK
jgi:tRNA pseudouridine55 synthase